MTRRHLRAPRQVYAIHYGADSALFTAEDEHTGNGRARHNHDIFKAWRPSDWVADLDMNRHFTLATSGTLTVHEPGLYLAYAQIHYLDEHDENGFRLLVNNQSILQCMVKIEEINNYHISQKRNISKIDVHLTRDTIFKVMKSRTVSLNIKNCIKLYQEI